MDLIKTLLEKQIELNTILNSITEGIVILDKEEKVLFVNGSSTSILGVPLENLALPEWPEGMGIFQVNQIQAITYQEMPIIRALNGQTLKDFRFYVKNEKLNDGIYISVDAAPLKDKEGNILAAIATFRDITQKIIREREIIEERIFFQKILDFIPADIMLKDLNGRYIYLNKHVREKYSGVAMDGKSVWEIFPSLGQQSEEDTLEILRTQKEIESVVELRHNDNSLHHYRAVRFPIFDNDNRITGICVMAFDVTQKVEQNKAIELARIKNINASKLAELGTLAAEIGHEINNPLSIIKTSLFVLRGMLEDGLPPGALNKQLDVIDATTTRISDIVNALRHVSRDSTKETFSLSSLNEILNDVKALCNTKFKIKNIKLEVDDSEVDLNQKVQCLRVQISQVLLNVLGNACDANEHVKDPWVKIKVREDEDNFFFEISDSGPGVPPEIVNHLFEPFFTTKGIGEGTGLGLSISKDIMVKQKGDLFLDCLKGSNCFVIRIRKLID